MNKFTPNLLSMIFTTLLVGLGLSYFSLADGRFLGTYHIGSWSTWANVGTPDPDPYTKAFVALGNTLQLGRSEGVQFIAQRDSDKELLLRECNYSIIGSTPPASFWTLRASAPDGHSITPLNATHSMHSKRLSRANDGIATIYVGAKLSPENWLEIEGEGYFELILTLYDASVLSGFGGTLNTLPIVKNEGCS